MWYFTIKQAGIPAKQYQQLQKFSELTEVEIFNEPYENYCIFEVETLRYQQVMDFLDREGIAYQLSGNRPTREELLESMKQWIFSLLTFQILCLIAFYSVFDFFYLLIQLFGMEAVAHKYFYIETGSG